MLGFRKGFDRLPASPSSGAVTKDRRGQDGSGSMDARRERTCLAGQPSLQLRRCPKGRFARAADMAALRRVSGLEPSGRRSKTALQSEEGRAGKHVGPPGQQEGSHDTGTSPSCRQERHPQLCGHKSVSLMLAQHLRPAFRIGTCRNGTADCAVASIRTPSAGQVFDGNGGAIHKPPPSSHRLR